MKRFILIFLTSLIFAPLALGDDFVLKTGVAVSDIPKSFFGSWRVTAQLSSTNNYGTFKPVSSDLWNLSRTGDTITLSNPFNGANAEISVRAVEGDVIVFSKKAPYDNKILTDTVTIRLTENTFSGINDLTLEHFSLVDNHLMKTESAKYIIKGEKISGESVLK